MILLRQKRAVWIISKYCYDTYAKLILIIMSPRPMKRNPDIIFACGIRNPGSFEQSRTLESGIPLTTRYSVGIQYLESGFQGEKSTIQFFCLVDNWSSMPLFEVNLFWNFANVIEAKRANQQKLLKGSGNSAILKNKVGLCIRTFS